MRSRIWVFFGVQKLPNACYPNDNYSQLYSEMRTQKLCANLRKMNVLCINVTYSKENIRIVPFLLYSSSFSPRRGYYFLHQHLTTMKLLLAAFWTLKFGEILALFDVDEM